MMARRTGFKTYLEYSHFGDDSKGVGLSGGDEPGTVNNDLKKCNHTRCMHEITNKVHRCINVNVDK